MKIAFLHSCLEPGRDGVGDYTRSLAQECIRQGHECCLVSLNDGWIPEASQNEKQNSNIAELRLSAAQPWSVRVTQAKGWINEFAPDWVSLQFVPYGWQPKGIVRGLGRRLQGIVSDRKLHIMFHELWLGDSEASSPKHRIIGAVQKHYVRQVVRQLRPTAMHTSNDTYVKLLQRSGMTAHRLPLFSGVPVTQTNANAWLFPEIQRTGLQISSANRSSFWLTGFFGSLAADWPPEPLFSRLSHAATQHQRHVVVLSVGRLGAGESAWNDLARRYSYRFKFCHLGPQSEERVSQYLNSLDFGLAAAPYTLIGKSSATAAMLDHGLPVIVSRDDIHYSFDCTTNDYAEPLLHKVKDLKLDDFLGRLKRGVAQPRLPSVAGQMLHDLCSMR